VFAGHWIWYRVFSIAELILGVILFAVGIIVACLVGIHSIKDAYKEALK